MGYIRMYRDVAEQHQQLRYRHRGRLPHRRVNEQQRGGQAGMTIEVKQGGQQVELASEGLCVVVGRSALSMGVCVCVSCVVLSLPLLMLVAFDGLRVAAVSALCVIVVVSRPAWT